MNGIPTPYNRDNAQTDIDADNAIQTDIIHLFRNKHAATPRRLLTLLESHPYVPSVHRVNNAHDAARALQLPAARISCDSMILMADERRAAYNALLRLRFEMMMDRVRPLIENEPSQAADAILAWYAVPPVPAVRKAPEQVQVQ